jgi:hypothetical protein
VGIVGFAQTTGCAISAAITTKTEWRSYRRRFQASGCSFHAWKSDDLLLKPALILIPAYRRPNSAFQIDFGFEPETIPGFG